MFKKFCLAVLAVFAILALAGCSGNDNRTYVAGGEAFRVGDITYVFLNAGEEIELDFEELYYEELHYEELYFGKQPPSIDKVTIESYADKVFNVHKNKIRADGTGVSSVRVILYCKNTSNFSISVRIHVINPLDKDMTEIKTAQDLADMAKNYGSRGVAYILKNDIDLKDFDNWRPIANYSEEGVPLNEFGGIFVNPYGYKIKNMTISTAANEGVHYGNGLFAGLFQAYVDGLILENVSIDTTAGDYIPSGSCYSGGISGTAVLSTIRNCSVNGNIVSQTAAGGIVGEFSHGLIAGSDFNGTVEQTSSENTRSLCGAGGIVGAGYEFPLILNCAAEATIKAATYAGGIAGYYPNFNDLPELYIKGCSFEGGLTAPHTDNICVHFGYPGQ